MANIITAVVRDSSGQIVAYADYRNDGSMPEHISKLAATPGNTISTTERKQSKKQDSSLANELTQRREQTNASNQQLAKKQEEEIKTYEKYSVLAERSGKQNAGQRVPEQKISEDSYKNLQKIQQDITANNELIDNFSGSSIASKRKDNVAKAQADAAAYTNRNSNVQAYAYREGVNLVDEKGGQVDTSHPRGMTREQAQEYNKQIIAVQMPHIIENRKAAQMGTPQTESTPQSTPTPVITTPVVNRTGTGSPSDPYKGKQPDRNLVSPYLQATYWTAPGTEKTFTTLSDAEAYLRQPLKTESSYIGFSPEGKAVQGPPQPQWVVDNLNPITKERFPNKTFKTEAEAIAYQKKFGKEETVVLPVGTLQYQYGQTPTDPFKLMIEKSYNRAGEMQNENMKKGFLGQIANVPLEAGKSVLGFGATVINLSEQYVDPYVEKTLNIKPSVKTAPIYLKEDTASMTQLSYDTKYTPQQNVKRWAGLQAEYIEKKGLPAYLVGGLENYYLVRSGVGAVKMGAGLVKKIGVKSANGVLVKNVDKMVDAPIQIRNKPLTRANEIDFSDFGERIGKSSLIKSKPVAAKQSDVRPFTPKRTTPVKEDVGYKPPLRANEVPQREGIIPKEDIKGEIRFSKGFIPSKVEPPLKGKMIEPVKPDPSYIPSKRANEIDLTGGGEIIGRFSRVSSKPVAAKQSDVRPFTPKRTTPVKEDVGYKPRGRYEGGFKDILKGDDTIPKELQLFKKTTVNLGKGQPERKQTIVKGKEEKSVNEDFFYKPSKRANEIDLTDAADSPKAILKEELKSEIPLDLKRELKRMKNKEQPVFKSEKVSFEGEGKYIAGKSGKQELMQIQKQDELTKKKLVSKRQSPMTIDWTEKIETAKLPSTGKSPVQSLILLPKEERRKKPVVQSAYSAYEIQLHKDRPQINSRSMTGSSLSLGTRSVLSSRISTSQVQPQKISTTTKQNIVSKSDTVQKSKLFEVQKLESKQKAKQVVKEQYKMPTPQVPKPKQTSIFKQKPMARQIFGTPEPIRPVKRLIAIIPPIDRNEKIVKKKLKGKKNQDFLGNTRLDKIEGFFKRSEIISGDIASGKQLKKDIKFKEGKKSGLGFSGKKLRI